MLTAPGTSCRFVCIVFTLFIITFLYVCVSGMIGVWEKRGRVKRFIDVLSRSLFSFCTRFYCRLTIVGVVTWQKKKRILARAVNAQGCCAAHV